MEIQSVIKNLQYKVLVRCMTYNQSRYIGDALNGFAIQQTSFQFVCLVMDDASTDGEQDVIRDFLDKSCDLDKFQQYDTEEAKIVIAKHRINDNCTFAVYFLKKNLFGTPQKLKLNDEWRKCCKYEALCEGDDYWTDPLKLQKQVDFLESNPDYSMCFHRAKVLVETKTAINIDCLSIENRDYSATEVFKDWIVPTASMVYRIASLDYPVVFPERVLNGDIIVVEKCAHTGKVRGLSDFMSVYRIQSSGVTYSYAHLYDRKMAYPGHFECLRDSFPKIDKAVVQEKIARRYFLRIFVQTSTKAKIHDWVQSYKASKGTCLLLTIKQLGLSAFRRINRIMGKR